MTQRAVTVLSKADVILCEDTRVSAKLLSHYGIQGKRISCHEHNQQERITPILTALAEGKAIALMTDAGMPLISDPGAPIVRAVQEAGFYVTIIPGATAPLCALAISGLPSDRFFFAGFLPTKAGARRQELSQLSVIPSSVILFESPQRLVDLLADLNTILPDREVAVVRELTKLHEEVKRGLPHDLLAYYTATPPRGEIVVIMAPPPHAEAATEADVTAKLTEALQQHSLRDAVAIVTAATGLPKREVYALAVAMTREKE